LEGLNLIWGDQHGAIDRVDEVTFVSQRASKPNAPPHRSLDRNEGESRR
jgi:hypothetical protein